VKPETSAEPETGWRVLVGSNDYGLISSLTLTYSVFSRNLEKNEEYLVI